MPRRLWPGGLTLGSAPPAAADLVARPCPVPAARWHLDALRTLGDAPAARVRRGFHARMLGHLLAPERADLRPLVTVLIPVYNRAAMVTEAVESCPGAGLAAA